MLFRMILTCFPVILCGVVTAESDTTASDHLIRESLQVIQTLDVPGRIEGICVSPSGHVIAVDTTSRDPGIAYVFLEKTGDSQQYVVRASVTTGAGVQNGFAFTSDSEFLLGASAKAKLNWRTGKATTILAIASEADAGTKIVRLPTVGGQMSVSRDGKFFLLSGQLVYSSDTCEFVHRLSLPGFFTNRIMFTNDHARVLYAGNNNVTVVANEPGSIHQSLIERPDQKLALEATCENNDSDYIIVSVIANIGSSPVTRSCEVWKVPRQRPGCSLVREFKGVRSHDETMTAPQAVVTIAALPDRQAFMFLGKERVAIVDPASSRHSQTESVSLESFGLSAGSIGECDHAATSANGRCIVSVHNRTSTGGEDNATLVIWQVRQ